MRKSYSLQKTVIIFLLIFAFILIGLVYIFQTVFLDDFYRENRTASLVGVAREVINNIDDNKLSETLSRISMDNEACVYVVSDDDNLSYGSDRTCVLNYLSYSQLINIENITHQNEGSYLFRDYHIINRQGMSLPVYIYAQESSSEKGDALVLVAALISPLDATIKTIQSQFWVIVLVVVILTIFLGYILSKKIASPIVELQKEATLLPSGKYNGEQLEELRISEFKKLNDTLISANSEIQKADLARKELLANISHDLRTPLTMIVGYAEMMKDIPGEKNNDNLDVVISEAKRLNALVDDLLDVSHIESNRLILNRQDCLINTFLNNIYHQYKKYMDSQNIVFELKLSEDGTVNIDEKRMQQVVYNFINNALNYNDSENKKIILSSVLNDNIYHISVKDNGNGIAEKDLNNIWDRYYRVNEEHRRSHIGSGIGLSLARDLLNLHGFKYGVDSKVNEYSDFWFEIPRLDKK